MKPSTHDLIAYLEQNELKYAQRSDDEDIVILGFTTQRASLSLMFICPDGHPNSPAYGHLKLPHLN